MYSYGIYIFVFDCCGIEFQLVKTMYGVFCMTNNLLLLLSVVNFLLLSVSVVVLLLSLIFSSTGCVRPCQLLQLLSWDFF